MIGQRLALMGLLLLFSGFFSGSETALFSLGEVRLGLLAKSRKFLDRTVAALLARPGALLTTILLANLTINVAFFSLAATTVRLLEGAQRQLVAGLGFLLAIVILGEIVPKAFALAFPLRFARLAAGPLWVVSRLLAPLRVVLMVLLRLLLGRFSHDDRSARFLSPREIQDFLASQSDHFDLDEETSLRLREVLDLAEIRVREAMIPRVDVPFFDIDQGLGALRATLSEKRLAWVVACKGESPDQAIGWLHARAAFLGPAHAPLADRLERLPVVPEVARLEAALEVLRREGWGAALVVDEYGGVAGVLTLERLLAEVFGPFQDEFEGAQPKLIKMERGVWRISGRFSAREWCERFAPDVELPAPVESIGGLFSALVGHIPRQGAETRFGRYRLKVLGVRRRRIEWIEMREEPLDKEGKA